VSRLVLYMSMSLDGFITGPDDRPGQELGRDRSVPTTSSSSSSGSCRDGT
jgi:hypothetical protein